MAILRSPALPAQAAAGADIITMLDTFEVQDSQGLGVTRIVITPPPGYATVTGVATNNVTFSVRQVRAGAVVATIASLTVGAGVSLVAETPVVVPITAPATPLLQADDMLDVLMHQNGTGLAIGAGLFVVANVT